jgi:hypothetical protein
MSCGLLESKDIQQSTFSLTDFLKAIGARDLARATWSASITALRTAKVNHVPASRSACHRLITRAECVSEGANVAGNSNRRRNSGSASPAHMTSASLSTKDVRLSGAIGWRVHTE